MNKWAIIIARKLAILLMLMTLSGCSGITAGNPVDKNEGEPDRGSVQGGHLVYLGAYDPALSLLELCVERVEVSVSGEWRGSYEFSRLIAFSNSGNYLFRLNEGNRGVNAVKFMLNPINCATTASAKIINLHGEFSTEESLSFEAPVQWSEDMATGEAVATIVLRGLSERLIDVLNSSELSCAISATAESCL